MRAPVAVFVLLCSSVAFADGEFPIPSVDGKLALATPDKKAWSVPLRFAAIEKFYRDHFKGQPVTFVAARDDKGGRVLKLTTKDPKAQWVRATIREAAAGSRVEVTQVLRAEAAEVEGNATPAVQFVIGRSQDAARMAAEIDHTAP